MNPAQYIVARIAELNNDINCKRCGLMGLCEPEKTAQCITRMAEKIVKHAEASPKHLQFSKEEMC